MRSLAPCAAALLLLAAARGGGRAQTAAPPTGQYDVAIKVVKHGRQVIALVPVTIDGHGPYTFALDTGASQSLVDSSVAKQLQVKKTGDTHQVAGVTSVAKVATIRVRHWQVGKVELPATTVVEANLPFGNADGGVQGLLGSDMLSEFDVVTIDYAHGVLRLHHRA